jgi:lipoprotein NlpI
MITGNYKDAIEDFNIVIKNDSTISAAFLKRGLAKINLKKKNEGCIDLTRAGELGNIYAYEEIQKHCR